MVFALPDLVSGHRADIVELTNRMPVSQLLGMRLVGFGHGVSLVELPIRSEITINGRVVQAGIIGTLADYAAVSAAISAKPDGWFGATANFQVQNVDQARGQKLVAIGRCVRAGARTGIGSAEVFAFEGDRSFLVALATAGCQLSTPERFSGGGRSDFPSRLNA